VITYEVNRTRNYLNHLANSNSK